MTLSYLISTLLYILPCFLLLFLTFRDRFRVPLIPRISVSLFIFSVIGLSGAYIFMALDSTLLRTLLSLPIMVSAVCLFCNAITYDFWQGVFIIAFVNCYVENVYVLSLYMHFAITKVFPSHCIVSSFCIYVSKKTAASCA